ncbi:hypothetical protein BABA_08441 [Neobacillus bataviensis LMG 21833]|uniref:Uncharacterized protein n=1 Tax=Neobacillus bataviensis LMG 21833 TaxID=1117379 RepID=K6E8Y5_9BACI|nr:hypothetical protein BABA_08441 [Neobacillus bataviensis LMG 21833]
MKSHLSLFELEVTTSPGTNMLPSANAVSLGTNRLPSANAVSLGTSFVNMSNTPKFILIDNKKSRPSRGSYSKKNISLSFKVLYFSQFYHLFLYIHTKNSHGA